MSGISATISATCPDMDIFNCQAPVQSKENGTHQLCSLCETQPQSSIFILVMVSVTIMEDLSGSWKKPWPHTRTKSSLSASE